MNSKRQLFCFTLLIYLFLISCSKCNEVKDNIIGQYGIEKKGIEVIDSTKGKHAAEFLKISSNEKFTFYDSYEKRGVEGEWKILSCKTVENNLGEYVPESKIEFKINNQKSLATFRDRRLTFDYPKNLYGDRYKSLWYVKLNMKK
jgi:hypothetical protein